eukprot:1332878-Amorphochlora_amoeboformis.AAC.2
MALRRPARWAWVRALALMVSLWSISTTMRGSCELGPSRRLKMGNQLLPPPPGARNYSRVSKFL